MHQCGAFVAPWNAQPLPVLASGSVLTQGLPHVGWYIRFYQYCWFQTSHAWDSSHSDKWKHSPSTRTICFGLGEVRGTASAISTWSSFTKKGHADILTLCSLMLSWNKRKHLKLFLYGLPKRFYAKAHLWHYTSCQSRPTSVISLAGPVKCLHTLISWNCTPEREKELATCTKDYLLVIWGSLI